MLTEGEEVRLLVTKEVHAACRLFGMLLFNFSCRRICKANDKVDLGHRERDRARERERERKGEREGEGREVSRREGGTKGRRKGRRERKGGRGGRKGGRKGGGREEYSVDYMSMSKNSLIPVPVFNLFVQCM